MKKPLVECTSVGCRLPECVARDVDELYKTLPSGCEYQRKAVNVDMAFEPGERAEVSILTNATVDKTNEVVVPEGVNLDHYRKSLVVLWNHNQDKPVARCGWIKLHSGKDIRAKTIYPTADEDASTKWHDFVDDVWAMTKSGVLKAKSIGFLPLTPKREPTADELTAHPDWEGAGIWDKSLLLEYSCVSVGCNHDALVQAINTKNVNPSNLPALGVDLPAPAVEKACSCHKASRLERYKSDECVSRKIPKLREEGYSEDQSIAIAYAHCAKCMKPRRAKNAIDINRLALDAIAKLNAAEIVKQAWEQHRNRGRV